MKKLSKIKLQEATVLSEHEMRNVVGGAAFAYQCFGDPFNGSTLGWILADPSGVLDIAKSIEENCGTAGGNCGAI